jgi:hypothetical protein
MKLIEIKRFLLNLFQFTCTAAGRDSIKAAIGIKMNGKMSDPFTFEEAVERFSRMINGLRSSDRDYLVHQKSPQLFATCLHNNLGRQIRNEWGLWNPDHDLYIHMSKRFGLKHADDLSSLILMCTYQRMNHLPMTPMDFAEDCKEYWRVVESTRGNNKSIQVEVDSLGITKISVKESQDDND